MYQPVRRLSWGLRCDCLWRSLRSALQCRLRRHLQYKHIYSYEQQQLTASIAAARTAVRNPSRCHCLQFTRTTRSAQHVATGWASALGGQGQRNPNVLHLDRVRPPAALKSDRFQPIYIGKRTLSSSLQDLTGLSSISLAKGRRWHQDNDALKPCALLKLVFLTSAYNKCIVLVRKFSFSKA